MTKKYSPTAGGFFDTSVHTTIPADAVDVSDAVWLKLLEGQSNGQRIVPDKTGMPTLQDPEPADAPQPDPKMVGVLYNGVRYSATMDDQNGLTAVMVGMQLQPATFPPTEFRFSNGSKLVLTRENVHSFAAVWMPFRQSFFAPSDASTPAG